MALGKLQSAILSFILFFITFSTLQIYSKILASENEYRILGGFGNSILFLFALCTVGNLVNQVGWIEVVICLFVSLGSAGTIHGMCVTTCFIFSGFILFYVNYCSKAQDERQRSINSGKQGKSRR
eukprot:TRINITY_DN134720_c0_g1_i1.p1 TRINITY_DN134720_c0_g1~~TRINITY_DN134720_c0_g1_i1.p1  ORF type:complete len:125 (-),score=15.74 TRINITY_DN134720_c0_g1_i1:93-467(-)